MNKFLSSSLTKPLIAVTSTAIVSRILTSAFGLITFPILLHYLGKEGFGVYSAILSVATVFVVADQGLAVGVRTRIAQDMAIQDSRSALRHYYSARTMTALACAVLTGLSVVAAVTLPWDDLFHDQAANLAVGAYLVAYSSCLLATVRLRALEGLGRSSIVATLPVIGSAWLLGTAYLGTTLNAGLVYFTLTAGLYNLLPLLLATLYLHRSLPSSAARQRTDWIDVLSAWSDSWPMAIVSLMLALSYSIDPLVLAAVLGPTDVTSYSAGARLYQIALIMFVASTPVLWTHVARERATNRTPSPAVLWRRTAPFGLVAALGGVGLVALGPWAISVWLGGAITVPTLLLTAFAALLVVTSLQIVPGTALTDRPSLLFQAKTCTAMAIANVPTSILLAATIGVSGPVWASALCLAIFHAMPLWVRAHRMQRPHGRTSVT